MMAKPPESICLAVIKALMLLTAGLLALLILIPCSLASETTSGVGEPQTLTRAEWVCDLVENFEMTVEADNYPDNYFADLSSEASYYRDILVAVEFGIIDIEAGDDFRPEDPLTREFAAQTLNRCVGFYFDGNVDYAFSDFDELSYPNDDQVAVNRSWFALIDGKFCPNENVARSEAEAMLSDAGQVWRSTHDDRLDPNHENSVTFAEGVVQIPEDASVETTDTEVIVYDADVDVLPGDRIGFISDDGFPATYLVSKVTRDEEGVLHLEYAEGQDDADSGIEDIDYEFSFDSSGAQEYKNGRGTFEHEGIKIDDLEFGTNEIDMKPEGGEFC